VNETWKIALHPSALPNDRGMFMLLDPDRNAVVAGERFDLSADDVIEFCAERQSPRP
jgi:hypothetical protein